MLGDESAEYINLTLQAEEKAQAVFEVLKKNSIRLVLAESCTAGLVSSLIANFSGASEYLWGSFVCYTQEAKVQMLGCGEDGLNKYGLVSRETACAMAEGALKKSSTNSVRGADIAAAVTGLAGPGGDGKNPVGTVWVAVAAKNKNTDAKKFKFTGERNIVRLKAVIAVMETTLVTVTKTA